MLENTKAFGSFSTNDLEKAKEFYGKTLGLEVKDEMDGQILSLQFKDGNIIMIYPKKDHIPAAYTVLNFSVDDINKTVNEFNKRGIFMEKYDNETIKTNERGIAANGNGPSIAWFKDPAGNILSLIEDNK